MWRRTLPRLAGPVQTLKYPVHAFVKSPGDTEYTKVSGFEGQSLMEIAKEGGMDIEAACDGACACSTCHCFVDEAWLDKLPEKTDDEEDMLDLAIDLRDNSRLSCQISMTKELSGIKIELPQDVTSQLL
ncbi:Adrenodoxin-like protein [Diplonema papillatum]|nr:Adrenodoxin-like protein [Diplonema papillatum]|eukprot:gene4358-6749_t